MIWLNVRRYITHFVVIQELICKYDPMNKFNSMPQNVKPQIHKQKIESESVKTAASVNFCL